MMDTDRERLRLRSGRRNPDFEINRGPDFSEAFVHHLIVPGDVPLEVHMPIEWVNIGSDDEIEFSADGQRLLAEARELVEQY